MTAWIKIDYSEVPEAMGALMFSRFDPQGKWSQLGSLTKNPTLHILGINDTELMLDYEKFVQGDSVVASGVLDLLALRDEILAISKFSVGARNPVYKEFLEDDVVITCMFEDRSGTYVAAAGIRPEMILDEPIGFEPFQWTYVRMAYPTAWKADDFPDMHGHFEKMKRLKQEIKWDEQHD